MDDNLLNQNGSDRGRGRGRHSAGTNTWDRAS